MLRIEVAATCSFCPAPALWVSEGAALPDQCACAEHTAELEAYERCNRDSGVVPDVPFLGRRPYDPSA